MKLGVRRLNRGLGRERGLATGMQERPSNIRLGPMDVILQPLSIFAGSTVRRNLHPDPLPAELHRATHQVRVFRLVKPL